MFKYKGLSEEDIRACDALFDALDLDGGGDIDLAELELGLANVQKLAEEQMRREASIQSQVSDTQANIMLCERAAVATEAAEATEAELKAITESPSTELKVGKQFTKYTKDRELAELLVEWDTNNDGIVDMKETVAGMRSCGVDGTDEELDELARKWDDDGSGTLDIDELKVAIEQAMEARKASETLYTELKRRLGEENNLASLRQRAAGKALSTATGRRNSVYAAPGEVDEDALAALREKFSA